MKLAAIVLLLLALAAGIFGWWGYRTPSGRRHFDEMAGMIPFLALIAALVLALAGLGCAWMARRAG